MYKHHRLIRLIDTEIAKPNDLHSGLKEFPKLKAKSNYYYTLIILIEIMKEILEW